MKKIGNLGLSVRSFNVLNSAELQSLSDILDFWQKNGSFLSIRNCGNRSNKELISLCQNFSESTVDIFDEPKNLTEMSLEFLSKSGKISERSKNVCNQNNLETLQEVINYYYINKEFKHLQNCGIKSNNELIELCKNYDENKNNVSPTPNKESAILEITMNEIKRSDLNFINNFILSQFTSLSNRSINVLKDYFSIEVLNFFNFRDVYLSKQQNISKFKRVGEKTIKEFKSLTHKVISFIYDFVIDGKRDDLLFEIFENLLITNFKLEEEDVLEFQINFLDKDIPLFHLVNKILNVPKFLDEKEHYLLKSRFGYFKDEKKQTLEVIAEEFSITRERIRQIETRIPDLLFKNLATLSVFSDYFNYPQLDKQNDIIFLNENFVGKTNENENTKFTSLFMSKILSVLLSDSYKLISPFESKRSKYKLKNSFLIRKSCFESINIESFLVEVESFNNKKREIDVNFDAVSFLQKYFKFDTSYDTILQFMNIFEKILDIEFNIFINIENEIIFPKNTRVKLSDIIFEILSIANRPLHLDEIIAELHRRKTPQFSTVEGARASSNSDFRFISFGRTSTYGLKEWESTEENIKGGTIKRMVENLLNENNRPLHILEIFDKVKIYRNSTTPENIFGNLKINNHKFIFYNQYFVGLKSKETLDSYIVYNKLPQRFGKLLTQKINDGVNNYTSLIKYFSLELGFVEDIVKLLIDYQIWSGFTIKNANALEKPNMR